MLSVFLFDNLMHIFSLYIFHLETTITYTRSLDF